MTVIEAPPSNPIVTNAAHGRLPEWAVVGVERRTHVDRVAELMGSWARALGRSDVDQERWKAAGLLHDALREADEDELRARVPPRLRALPAPLLHGPAAAERLRIDGLEDGELLRAVAWHTVGNAGFGQLGRALYAADFLEPGRPFLPEWRAGLRSRMPHELDEVVFEIVQARLLYRIEMGAPVLPETLEFWNRLAEERS